MHNTTGGQTAQKIAVSLAKTRACTRSKTGPSTHARQRSPAAHDRKSGHRKQGRARQKHARNRCPDPCG
eukprot:6164405-Prymnesium_polylepis.1